MILSAPIYRLKRNAKTLARAHGLPLHAALDRVAVAEGFQSWSHLAASHASDTPAKKVLAQLEAGQLALIGARPGHGKTLLALELTAMAAGIGRQGFFFTLDYHDRDVAQAFAAIGTAPSSVQSIVIDTSDDISANYIISHLKTVHRPPLIVVDYLQLLDQKRSNPVLDEQMAALKAYVIRTCAICVLISQIDRRFELTGKQMPDASEIRFANPCDMSVFDRLFFLHDGQIRMDRAA